MSSIAAKEPNPQQMTELSLSVPSSAVAPPLSLTDGDGDPSTMVLRNRGAPSTMGTVRLGGSSRPFPVASDLQALTRSAASHGESGGMTSSRTATVVGASDRKRHVSPKKLVLVPDDGERFHVRKSIIKTLPHKRKLQGGTQIPSSTKQKAVRPAGLDSGTKKDDPPSFSRSLQAQTTTTKTTTGAESVRHEVREPLAIVQPAHRQLVVVRRPPAINTSSDRDRDLSTIMLTTTKMIHLDGAIHSVNNGNPVDLQLFTQRTEDKSAMTSTNKAFHEHSAIQSSQGKEKATSVSHGKVNSKTPWRQVDESIEHIYEDPSTDFVQLKLLAHKSGESSKRQKMLERERVLAAAAELREREARERAQFEALQRKKSQVEQLSEAIRARNRKLVVVKSEPIYEAVDRVGAGAVNLYDDVQETESKRKPPVPRQHGRRKAQLQTRNSQLKAAIDAITQQSSQRSSASAPVGSVSNVTMRNRSNPERQQSSQPGSVSSSILLGNSGEFVIKDVRQSIGEESQEVGGGEASLLQESRQEGEPMASPPEQRLEAEQRPPPPPLRRPRTTRRTPRPHKTQVREEEPIPVVSKEKSERRELAREFMELQKQSRQLRSAKEKKQLEVEKQRRRLQLEKLEQERIESLQRSKKKSFKRSRVSTKAESGHHSINKSFRGRSETDDKSAGFSVSDDDAAETENFHRVANNASSDNDDDGDEFFASDQENQRNNRNWSFERASRNSGGHDASVLIGCSSTDGKHSPVATPKEADVRLRRLLELEEKTLRLSMLVNGMKGRKAALPSTGSTQRHMIKEEEASEEADLRFPTPRQDDDLNVSYGDQVDTATRHGDEEEKALRGREDDDHRSDEEESEVGGSVRSEEVAFHSAVDRPSPTDRVFDQGDDDLEANHVTETQYDMTMHLEEVRLPTSASIDATSIDAQLSYLRESHEFDPRTIGVQSIKVEWPMQHHSDDDEEADRDHSRVSPRHSAVSSQASPLSELHQFDQEQLLSSSRASVDSNQSEDPFEASIMSYMQQRQMRRHDAEASDEDDGHEASSSHSSLRVHRAELASARHVRTSSEANDNEVFLRLAREADDSLSVINNTAQRIWLQQQQKRQAQTEKQRQRELEALIEEQERKNQQLQAVMDSLTSARKHVLDSDDGSESEEQTTEQNQHESVSSPEGELSYNRLEDIIQQIQDEKLREKQTASSQQQHDAKQDVQYKPASLFWNDMLASSEPLTRNTNNSMKLRTVIDRSELLKQQTQREQEEEDALFSQSYQDELKRIHSPKTLSRLLLAEVEYNESIHEAHLQLSIMEHAQVVEQAQEETMNVATAFKEEMDSNFTNHQLALEHVILAKQFDGDLQGVMQELETIQQTQAQELADTTASLQHELKVANRREATVQTEELKRTDVATNAKLYSESGTATSPLVCDAGVQYEAPETSSLVVDQNSLISQQLQQVQALLGNTAETASVDDAYSEEEYEEDNFERESQSVMTHDSVKQTNNKAGASSGSANSDIPEDDDELEDGSADYDHISEAESIHSEDEEMVKKLKQSVAASSTNPYQADEIHSEAYDEEEDEKAQSEENDSVESSAVDEASALSSDREQVHDGSESQTPMASASMGYEDDFDVSSSQVHATKKSDSVGSEEIADDDDAESDAHSSNGSAVIDDIEDGVPSKSDLKTKSDGVVASEGSEYSSKFSSGAAKGESRGTPAATAKAVSAVQQTLTEGKPAQAAVTRYTETEYNSVSMVAIAGTDDVVPTYQRDLEQRKRSDESLLHLRLQVLERKFQMDVQAIDQAISSADGMPGKLQELLLRKEAAKMVFLSEKASVESLRAASMARYYQDLLAFQSLMAGVDSSISAAVPRAQYAVANLVGFEVRSDDLRHVIPKAELIKRNELGANITDSVKNEYEDEFDSVSEKAELKAEEDEVSEGDVKSQDGSVSGSERSADDDETSEIQEDEVSSAIESIEKAVESDHEDDEGDAYDDEFASVSKSDAVDLAQESGEGEEDGGEDAAIDDDAFEKEEASVKSAAPSEAGSVAEDDEFVDKPSSIESKDLDDKNVGEDEDFDDDYEDEFASVSESEGAKPSSQVITAADDEIMDEASADGGDHPSPRDDETSEIQSEDFEADDFESEDESHGAAVSKQEAHTKVDSNLLYSNDFETSAAHNESALHEDSQSASKQQLDVAGSIVVAAAVERSESSEDSSTTKLLIEQVQHLHGQTEKHEREAEVEHAKEKLARKKIKAIELVQAKERLIKLKTTKFRLEEEQRQVNALAQLAIQMDVQSEFSKAKEQIKQQLEVEMASVQQSFPVFTKGSDAGAIKVTAVPDLTRLPADAIKASPLKEVEVPASMAVVVQETTLKAPSFTEADKEGDASGEKYEIDSFENEHSAAENASGGDGAYDEDYPSFAEEEDESQVVEESKPLKKMATAVDERDNSEIASDAEDEFASVSGDDADGAEIRSEPSIDEDDSITTRARDGDEKSEEASVDDYADEYEDESFDDAKSAASAKTKQEDAETIRDAEVMESEGSDDDEVVSDQYDNDDEEYSEEDFEKTSEASAAELKHENEAEVSADEDDDDQDVPPPVASKPDPPIGIHVDQQQQHVSIDELSTALDAVTSQLYQPTPNVADSVDHSIANNLTAHDASVTLQADQNEDSRLLPAQLSVSVSHEEEVLSKSIEEQTKRLEELKHMILARKDEILSVQKHMRIEKRKEQLTGEEKQLWDEMERVEANLRMDETAFELTRQRNRLEAMRLEVKHEKHKAKLTGTKARSFDLLEGFDFVEMYEIPNVQANSKEHEASESTTNKTVWGATSDMICQTDSSLVARMAENFDLLTGYVYVEETERVAVLSSEAILPTVSSIMGDVDKLVIADDRLSDDETAMGAFGDGGGDECASKNDEESSQNQDHQDTSLAHESDIQCLVQVDAAADLLSSFSYVEDAELVSEEGSDADLLVSFDFVERVDPVESHEISEQPRGLELHQMPAAMEDTDELDHAEDSARESEGNECMPPVSSRDTSGYDDDMIRTDSTAYHPEDQQRAPDPSVDAQPGSREISKGVELADRVADVIYGDLFDDIWKDSQERRREASRELKQAQDARGLSREPDDVEAGDDEEFIESIATDTDTADYTEHVQSFEETTDSNRATKNHEEPVAASEKISSDVLADQITDTLFDKLYDQVLNDSVLLSALEKKTTTTQSSQHDEDHASESKNETTGEKAAGGFTSSIALAAPRAEPTVSANQRPSAAPVAERDFVRALVQRLEISTEGIRLPAAYGQVAQSAAGLRSARIITESVREIAISVLSRHAAATSGDDNTEIDVEALRQEVQVEMEKILAIRDTGSEELKKLIHSFSENDVSDDGNSETSHNDLRLMQTQFRTNVSHVTDHMRRYLLLAGGARTTTASGTPGSLPRSFYPRTPTPRASSSSASHHRPAMLVHTLLRHESAQLHERITDLILDDLLSDTTTGRSNGDEVSQ